MKNPQLIPLTSETRVEFLILVNRAMYRARFVTSGAVYIADPGEWETSIQGKEIIIAFSKGRIIDPQNRAFVTEMLSVRPVRIVIPFEYPISVSSLGIHPRYYVRLPRACSLTFESARQ